MFLFSNRTFLVSEKNLSIQHPVRDISTPRFLDLGGPKPRPQGFGAETGQAGDNSLLWLNDSFSHAVFC